ncbi:hypothetical protein ACFWIB_14855 [Streptomyces sp. NPDC127051]|uniref:hypothetical protein n=1 Tax=Streptomyces sp. NPDC127051 TaxID=3347119 RepID=UPI00365F43D2
MPDLSIQPFPSEPPRPGGDEAVSIPFPDTRDPLDKWEQPDGYWSDEMTAMVAECQVGTRSVIPCPACGRKSTAATVDTISLESMLESPAVVRYSRSGRVYTLTPCGHALRR